MDREVVGYVQILPFDFLMYFFFEAFNQQKKNISELNHAYLFDHYFVICAQ